MEYRKTLGVPDPRKAPPSFCGRCNLPVVQIFLAEAPANALSYICDAEPVPFMEGIGNDIVIDIYGKVRRGRILVAAAKSANDEAFYTIHTEACDMAVKKANKGKKSEVAEGEDDTLWGK